MKSVWLNSECKVSIQIKRTPHAMSSDIPSPDASASALFLLPVWQVALNGAAVRS